MRRAATLVLFLILAACSSSPQTFQPTATRTPPPKHTATLAPTASPTLTSTPQPRLSPVPYGPELDDFPAGVNPLTGRAVQDPSLLDLPAVLVSISNMPVTTRPQAGPGFAAWVYELYIGEGATRFMNVFYGDYPRSIPHITGGCEMREEITRPAGDWIGNRVWLDENANGRQDAWEAGVGGVCVRLLDGGSRQLLEETGTDSNGYYAFDHPGGDVLIQVEKTDSYQFTQPDLGDDDLDSDVSLNGETKIFHAGSTASHWDAGLILSEGTIATPNPAATATPWYIPAVDYVGPIRSGRLTYNQIGRMFPNSCLVYASAAWDIGEMLDACEIVFGVDKTTPNSALLPVTRLRELAEENLNPRQPVNYSGNLFSEEVPEGGTPATDILVHYHAYTQSAWQYDPVSGTYLRWTDLADGTGSLVPAFDRLSQRQLAFENVIVLLAEHNRYRHNQLEVDFTLGQKNFAYLFRDGQVIKIYWTTANREWEKTTGLVRPMHFVDARGNLVPLHPGRTWIHIVTPYSNVGDQGDGRWQVNFVQPYDPEDTPVPE
ncbi:MAG TPA: SdrD B-like domain-containing protein [Anaerolineales bacterium]|nr:SdrD B-like domain-containing protein [Anaerolineales bacterium]